jgi:uncharacterized protein (TIGR02099 family)
MLKASLRFAWRSLNHLTRVALIGTMLVALATGGLIIALRYWVLPDIERYHDDITASVSTAIGQPVTIDKITADWQGIRPHLSLVDVRIMDRQGQAALTLRHVDTTVSWLTLLTGDVRLYSLELSQPDLSVRRDAQGQLYVAGILLSRPSSGNGLSNWLLRQSRIAVRDARITWQDDLRAAPPLVLDQVNLLIRNSGSRHEFAVRALPPADLSAGLDVRGDFSGDSFDTLHNWNGELYTQFDYADLAAWRPWLPLPEAFRRGRGALRAWLGFEDGKASRMTADLALAGVRTRLGEDLPPLDLRTLRGRIALSKSAQRTEVTTRGLALQMSDGLALRPTDFQLGLDAAQDGKPAGGEINANVLELADLARLAEYLPLEQGIRHRLTEYAPRGRVSGLRAKWQGDSDKLLHYSVKARFDRMSLMRVGKTPGFSGLSGEVDGDDAGGTLKLNAHDLTLDAPEIMPEPLAFGTFSAQGDWESGKQGLEVKFSKVSAENADLSGTVHGSYRTLPDSPGRLDLTVHLARAAVVHADRYIPLHAVDSETHAWLRDALRGGVADEFDLRLNGDLKDFPFPENKKGIFRIHARVRNAMLEYDKAWPRIDNIGAELLIEGKRLEVTSPSAMTLGEQLKNVSVAIPDLTSPDMVLQVRGGAAGETARGLDFISKSPVHGYIDNFTDGMTASGIGTLNLLVDVPLRGSKPVKVAGAYRFINNDVDMGSNVPTLYRLNGELSFTESQVSAKTINAQILGGPAMLTVRGDADGVVHVKVNGHTNFDELRKTVSNPLLPYLHGGSDWEADVTAWRNQTDVLVTSDLAGMVSNLPEPFAKTAREVIPSRFEKRNMRAGQDMIVVEYGNEIGAKFLRREESGSWAVERGVVNFGGMGRWPSQSGVWLTGTVPELSLKGWGGLLLPARGGGMAGDIAGANLQVQKLDVYGYQVNGLHIGARSHDGVLSARLAAEDVNGEISWTPQDKGKLEARLKNLYLEKSEEDSRENVSHLPVADASATTEYPALDFVVDDFMLKGKQLGKLELQAQQEGRDWLLNSVRISNPDGVLTLDGKWHVEDGMAQTQANFKLEVSDAGKILTRFGYPDGVKNGKGKIEGTLSWPGAPDEFDNTGLDGTLKLDAGKGRFVKLDPGAGKLLSILSLQALPRHITLDFTDVFSEGFDFDSITGTAQIKHGLLTTSDFKMDGSSAKVSMSGQIDLAQGTQNLNVVIRPTVGNTVSFLGALAAGPVAGVGAFLVNKLLREPLDKLASFEYNVTGTWSDPNVVKVKKQPAATPNRENLP